ncbi:fungal-specific transcription factor domain-containing protein [Mycena floridula]|nr:fungal-specific transcription factor domain-containing protein [Mycena floridula]
MSSNEELVGTEKKPRTRACLVCRSRKVKCDADSRLRCSNCIQARVDCVFVKKSKPTKSYVHTLERRLKTTEGMLRQYLPDGDLDSLLAGKSYRVKLAPQPPAEDNHLEDAYFVPVSTQGPSTALSFYGKSSEISLVRSILELREDMVAHRTKKPDPYVEPMRPEFWNPRPWEIWCKPQRPVYQFPPHDLMILLIDLYFRHVNIVFPVLHRPTFEKALAKDEHLDTSSQFGTLIMLVSALAARFSDDPRVLLDGGPSLSSGWKWYEPVLAARYCFLDSCTRTTTLYELQAACLSAIFEMGRSQPNSLWLPLGIAIRAAQDIGAHRKKPTHDQEDPVANESLKRAWWVLVCLDVLLCTVMGRSCLIPREDFDVDLPIDCDDEYWEHPNPKLAFKQPPNKPSKLACFIHSIRLVEMMAATLRRLYCINKTQVILASAEPEWRENSRTVLESAMQQWVEDIPDHLKWNPDHKNITFFIQSVQIQCLYSHLQILVHRPFFPTGEKPSALSNESLAICTKASLSCINIVDQCHRRTGLLMPFAQIHVFMAGAVLLFQVWSGPRTGLNVNVLESLAHVKKCLDSLSRCESRWAVAGRLVDLLGDLTVSEDNAREFMAMKQDKRADSTQYSLLVENETEELLNVLASAGNWVNPNNWPTSDQSSDECHTPNDSQQFVAGRKPEPM